MALLAADVFKAVDDLFPKHSWPWTLTREAVFMLDGRSRFLGLELEHLYDGSEMGPLGFLATATLLGRIQSPDARLFAARGLERLDVEDFRRDARLLLDGGSAVARVAGNLIEGMRGLTETEIRAFADVLPPAARDPLWSAARRLRERGNTPALEVIMQWLDERWEQDLRFRVAGALRALRDS